MWALVGAILGFVATSIGENKKRSQLRKLQALNAARLETQAQTVERQTEEDVVSLRQRLTRVVGEQRAGWGASGFSGDSGSALDVMASSITEGLNDQRRRREAGEVEAADLRWAGKIGDMSARAAIEGSKSATISAGADVIGQAAKYYGSTVKK
jgi:hypothetical protein